MLVGKPNGINVAEYVEYAENDAELMEVLLTYATLNDKSQVDNTPHASKNEEKRSEETFQKNIQ